MRGVLASPKIISKKILEDVIDFIELSNPEIIKETEKLVKEANLKKSWLSFDRVHKLARKAK